MPRLLEDQVAIVTGASQGLGAVLARAFAVDGAQVLLVARREKELAQVVASMAELDARAVPLVCDVTQPEAAQSVVDYARASFGRVDTLVNNAGVFVWKPLFSVEAEDWIRTIETNLSAPFFLSLAAAKAMKEQESGGSIINIASIHGLTSDPNVVPHCASKFGLVGLTRAMADALREHRIRVNAIAPGAIDPDSGERWGAAPSQKVTQADIASLAVYLSSHLSRSITGSVIEMLGSTRSVIKA